MPNWVKNKVYFENKNVIKDCYVESEKEDYFDFDKIIPRPRSLDLPSGSFEESSIRYVLYNMEEDKKQVLLHKLKDNNKFKRYLVENIFYPIENLNKDYERFDEVLKNKKDFSYNDIYEELNIKNLNDLGNAYINNIINYGYSDWYDWSCANWGTKWNACSTYYIDENNIEFETAWSTPEPVFKEISKKYNTKVVVKYADEDLGYNCGTLIFENGELTEWYEEDRQFAIDLWGYEE